MQVSSTFENTGNCLFALPIEIRGSIWCHLQIKDLGNLILLCKTSAFLIQHHELKYIARNLMKIEGIQNLSLKEMQGVIKQTHHINYLFAKKFSLPISSKFILLHQKIEQAIRQDIQFQRIIQCNQILINNYETRNRLLAYLTKDLKDFLFLQTKNSSFEHQAYKFMMKSDNKSIDLNDLLANTPLFQEFIKHDYNLQKLFKKPFGIRLKIEQQMSQLMNLCAVFKWLNCSIVDLNNRQISPALKELFLNKWGFIHSLLPYLGKEIHLKNLLRIAEERRYQIIKNSEAIIQLLNHKMLTILAIQEKIAVRTICDAHKVYEALNRLYIHVDQETRDWLLSEPKLVEEIYEQAQYLQELVDHFHFNFNCFLKMNSTERKSFVNHSRKILKLCQMGKVTLTASLDFSSLKIEV